MTVEDALKIFEKVYSLHEQMDMQNDMWISSNNGKSSGMKF